MDSEDKSLKSKLKQEFVGSFEGLKSGALKDKWFIFSLAALTLVFVLAMFFEWAIFIAGIMMCLIAIFFDFEKTLALFLYSYSFYGVFLHIEIFSREMNLNVYFFSLIFFICAFKYLIDVFKLKKELNYKLILVIMLIFAYIYFPIHKVGISLTIQYLVIFAVFYLLIERKNEISIKTLVLYASMGLIISSFISYLAPLSERMPLILAKYVNFGVVKFQGLFINPNGYAVYINLLLPFVVYYCLQRKGAFWFVPLTILTSFAYMTLSRNYLICVIIIFAYYLISVCIRKDKRMLIGLGIVAVILLFVCVCEQNNTKVYLARFGFISTESITPSADNDINIAPDNSNELWIDGTPLDPGRVGIWKRYLKDFASSPINIVFGAGMAAELLGIDCHNFYLQYLWRFGILGVLLLLFTILPILLKLIKNIKSDKVNLFVLVFLFTLSIEAIFIDYLTLICLILLITSCEGNLQKKEKNYCKDLTKINYFGGLL